MARNELDREDLLREATALVCRCELQISSEADPIVIGFRSQGAASFYFGGDTNYQFNSLGELRRAHVGPHLYRAEKGRLIRLFRERTSSATSLVRHELTSAELDQFLAQASHRLGQLLTALNSGSARLVRCVPTDVPVVSDAAQTLAKILASPSIARSARVS